MQTLKPDFLGIPERLLDLLPPKALGYRQTNENFQKKTGLTFDPLAAAESAADLSIRLLLHPERASRLVEYKSRNNALPGLADVLRALIENSWKNKVTGNSYFAEVNRVVGKTVLSRILLLAEDRSASGQARAIALSTVYDLEKWMQEAGRKEKDSDERAHLLYGMELIRRYRENPEYFKSDLRFSLPQGSPIGNGFIYCDF
jgi:hypothetical protein